LIKEALPICQRNGICQQTLQVLVIPKIIGDIMNAYQEKWIGLFQGARIPNWQVKANGDDVEIQVPADVDLKILRDNFPQTVAAMSLDITIPKERVRFVLHNGQASTEYILNPTEGDLNEA
jgi:hypothetical protein